jgi:hypothetical protein
MYRNELPRIYELIDQMPASPDGYFIGFDNTTAEDPIKLKHFLDIEKDLQGLDSTSWEQLKTELIPLLTVRDVRRGWHQLFEKLNEAKGYNYLVREVGCTNVRFIPRSMLQGRKSPDLEGSLGPTKVFCEVKTINISEVEVSCRNDHTVRSISNRLAEGFFNKLKTALETAGKQMEAHTSIAGARKIVCVIVNYDDLLHEYAQDYSRQIDAFIGGNPVPGLEVFFDSKPPFYSATA